MDFFFNIVQTQLVHKYFHRHFTLLNIASGLFMVHRHSTLLNIASGLFMVQVASRANYYELM